jgi:hypothetical protein
MLLRYDISITGEQNVRRALASVEQQFVRHNRNMARQLGATGGSRAGRVGDETAKLARAAEALDRQRSRALGTQYRQKEKLEQRSHTQALKNIERETKARQRASESLDRQRSRALMAQYRSEERRARQDQASRRKFFEGAFGKVGSSVRGSLSAVGQLGSAALGLGGGFAVAGAIQTQMAEGAMASKLANQAGDPSLKGQLLKESRGVKGFTGEEVLGAMSGFVGKTGDLNAARGLMQDLSKLALATGTDFGEMGEAAGQAFNVIRDTITDPKEQLKAVNDVMRSLAKQGNLGAVEIKDMVTELAGLGAATRKFEGGPVGLIKTAGAMAQAAVARGGAASADEATSAVTRFSDDIIKNTGGAFDKAGINRFTDSSKTKLRGPQDLMLDILEKTGGDLTKVNDMFGIYAQRAVGGFAPLYTEAEKKQKGSGRAAVKAEFDKYANATMSDADISRGANSRLDDADLKFKEVLKDFNTQVGGTLLPIITELIPKFADLIPHAERLAVYIGRLVEEFAKDPIGGVAKLAAAKLAFDIAASSAGNAAKRLSDGLANAAAGIEGAGGKLKAAGLGFDLGITAATVIVSANLLSFEKMEADATSSGKALTRIQELKDASKTRALTPEEQSEARDKGIQIDKTRAEAGKEGLLESFGNMFTPYYMEPPAGEQGGLGTSMFGDSRMTSKKTQEGMSKTAEQALQDIAKNTAAMAANGGPNRGNAPSSPTPTGK